MNARALLGLCLGGLLCAIAPAQAQPSPYLGRDNPLASLLPTAGALAARERAAREHEITRALSALSNVEQAEVLIRQPDSDTTPLDTKPPACSVLVRLTTRGVGPSELQIESVVRARLPALEAGRLQVTRTPAPARSPEPSLARVGPFLVAHESSSPLRATLITCLVANALLATLLLVRRRAR